MYFYLLNYCTQFFLLTYNVKKIECLLWIYVESYTLNIHLLDKDVIEQAVFVATI